MKLNVTFSEIDEKTFNVQLQQNRSAFDAQFGQVQHITEYVGGELFEGDCTVTPRVEEQIMETKEKVMPDNVTIRAIPVYRVSNMSGGTTVYIASEV